MKRPDFPRWRLASLSHWRTRVVFWGGAFIVGAVAASFAIGAEYANRAVRGWVSYGAWLPFLVSPLGLMGILWLTRRVFPRAEGSGIPQAIAALELPDEIPRGRLLSARIALGKIVLTLLGLLIGASIGREGPTVHIGAAIMYSAGRLAHFPRHTRERGLILAGGAAGIAAAFNTPIAGIMFAIEEMSRSFEERTSGTLLIAVIIAGITAIAINGNYTYFGSTSATLGAEAWWIVPACGLVGGFFGGAFSRTLIAGTARVAPWMTRYPYRVAAACGLALALLGWLSGNTTYGTGYDEAKGILTETHAASMLYPAYKLLATIVSYLSGIPGGIFAPSLATGAGLGADLAHAFPSAPAAAVIILGMVSYFSGVVQTPITAFVIVMEMTGNHTMLLPLMAASFIAYGTSRLICPEPIYRVLARRFLSDTPPTASAQDGPAALRP